MFPPPPGRPKRGTSSSTGRAALGCVPDGSLSLSRLQGRDFLKSSRFGSENADAGKLGLIRFPFANEQERFLPLTLGEAKRWQPTPRTNEPAPVPGGPKWGAPNVSRRSRAVCVPGGASTAPRAVNLEAGVRAPLAPAPSLGGRPGTWRSRRRGRSAVLRAFLALVPERLSERPWEGSDHGGPLGTLLPPTPRECQNSGPSSGWPRGAPHAPRCPLRGPGFSPRGSLGACAPRGSSERARGAVCAREKEARPPGRVAHPVTERDLGKCVRSRIQAALSIPSGSPRGQGRPQGGRVSWERVRGGDVARSQRLHPLWGGGERVSR